MLPGIRRTKGHAWWDPVARVSLYYTGVTLGEITIGIIPYIGLASAMYCYCISTRLCPDVPNG